jgi:hypothetical protein
MPFEGMSVKSGNYNGCGVAFGVLKPSKPVEFRDWVPSRDPNLSAEEWISKAADDLVQVAGTGSVIVMLWGKNFILTVVRGEFFEEADVKEEFLHYVSFLDLNA